MPQHTNSTSSSSRERGAAALEGVFFITILVGLLLGAVEGTMFLRNYSMLVEATREGARMVLREGAETNVQTMVNSMLQNLPNTKTVTVTKDLVKKTVKVEVSYVHTWSIWAGESTAGAKEPWNFMAGYGGPLTITARSLMPLP